MEMSNTERGGKRKRENAVRSYIETSCNTAFSAKSAIRNVTEDDDPSFDETSSRDERPQWLIYVCTRL